MSDELEDWSPEKERELDPNEMFRKANELMNMSKDRMQSIGGMFKPPNRHEITISPIMNGFTITFMDEAGGMYSERTYCFSDTDSMIPLLRRAVEVVRRGFEKEL